MHDCSGLTNASGAVASKYREWAQLLVRDGFIVLFPESYGSRGLGSQCTVRNRPVRPDRWRVADANASRRWLDQLPDLPAAHILLPRWSDGRHTVPADTRPRA